MTLRRILPALTLGLMACLAGGPTVAQDASTSPGIDAPTPPRVWLKGVFGRVLGGDPEHPATAAPDGRPLEAWMRREPLTLETDVALGGLLSVSVQAQAADASAPPLLLSTGATAFAGPDRAGVQLISATVRSESYGPSTHTWLVDIPDRDGDSTALFDVPGPEAFLASNVGSVKGAPGHGCYAYMCREAGYRPPLEALEPLRLSVGEAPILRLSDGSALAGWTGRLEALSGARPETFRAMQRFTDEPQASPQLTGLEPPLEGEWLLELRTDYDRERGWQWSLFRLIAE